MAHLPELGTDLVTALAALDMNDLTHLRTPAAACVRRCAMGRCRTNDKGYRAPVGCVLCKKSWFVNEELRNKVFRGAIQVVHCLTLQQVTAGARVPQRTPKRKRPSNLRHPSSGVFQSPARVASKWEALWYTPRALCTGSTSSLHLLYYFQTSMAIHLLLRVLVWWSCTDYALVVVQPVCTESTRCGSTAVVPGHARNLLAMPETLLKPSSSAIILLRALQRLLPAEKEHGSR